MAGIALEGIDRLFEESTSCLRWDVLCLQEAFVKTEGIECKAGHVIYTPMESVQGLRVPAIIVNAKHAVNARYLASGIRWVAAEILGVSTSASICHMPGPRRLRAFTKTP